MKARAALVGTLLLLGVGPAAAAAAAAPGSSRLAGVTSWGYQLQGAKDEPIDLAALARAPHALLVIEPSDGNRPLTAAEVAKLKTRPDGSRRKVIAYLSIGEAEDYRPYFVPAWKKRPPPFLGPANPAWKGNFKVRYWHPAWRKIVLAAVDKILIAGFDGLYLDVIDGYEYFGPGGEKPERKAAAADMAELVIAIARHARRRADVAIIPQNGAGILDEIAAPLAARYLGCIDAIGAEDTFFYGTRDEDNPLAEQREALAALGRFRSAGKVVLAVEYLTDPKLVRTFIALAGKHGFVPYVGRRALDRLVPPVVPSQGAPP